MSSLVIAALPAEDDYVNKISSEKVAHMTLLFLGEADQVKNFSEILTFVGHAANRSLKRFGLEVDRRAVLGDEEADVLFFSKSKWSGFEEVNEFRSYLLKDDNIRAAYDSIEQFSEWIPHLTLGYPSSPAKPDTRDYPGITYVNFDRIAVWFGEFEGIEFPLKAHDWSLDVAMSNVVEAKKAIENILTHHGVKGMKWGVRRKATVGPQEVIVRDSRLPGHRLKTSGGSGHPAVAEAVRARQIGQISRKSGLKALSNKDLEDYNRRLNLEQSAKRLRFEDAPLAQKVVLRMLGQAGNRSVSRGLDEGAKAAGRKALKLAAAAAA